MSPEPACRETLQPNDPARVPVVGAKLELEVLIAQCVDDAPLLEKLQSLHEAFPHFRPVLGDGNCFYRWCAFADVLSCQHG